jgi:hypothetical protein
MSNAAIRPALLLPAFCRGQEQLIPGSGSLHLTAAQPKRMGIAGLAAKRSVRLFVARLAVASNPAEVGNLVDQMRELPRLPVNHLSGPVERCVPICPADGTTFASG